MTKSLFRVEVLPFLAMFALLLAAAMLGDWLLHKFNLVWVGRYLGIPGVLIILLSFTYSLRKRKVITVGTPRGLLRLHEFMTWFGSMIILIHAGIHFNAILPWLAVAGMLINVISGLTGKFLLERSQRHLAEAREQHQMRGLSKEEIEQAMFWDSITFDLMRQWRVVHLPITLVFAVLSIGHIVSVLVFWGWR
jgi:hypothetical protein